jgi:hypothetical protein
MEGKEILGIEEIYKMIQDVEIAGKFCDDDDDNPVKLLANIDNVMKKVNLLVESCKDMSDEDSSDEQDDIGNTEKIGNKEDV